MEIVMKGNTSCFQSSEKSDSFIKELVKCKTEDDYKKVTSSEYLKEGFAYTLKKTTSKLFVNLMTEKEAKRVELKMRLRDRINHMKNGQKEYNKKIKNEKKVVDKRIFKKYVKATRVGGTKVISPSDIINDVQKYGQMCSMMSHPMFSRQKIIQDYYQSMKEHLGLPDFKLPDNIKKADKADENSNVNKETEKTSVDLNNEHDTEEEVATEEKVAVDDNIVEEIIVEEKVATEEKVAVDDNIVEEIATEEKIKMKKALMKQSLLRQALLRKTMINKKSRKRSL